ncbi:hypothetical protein [Sporomusa sp. KB1]|jgi:hypothetical protein|uniref:hypothetical protein n=1 Tax=Sporomusa sp. KB1 TaxID=943346 RepID=UPI0011A59EC5|nr:hypothetical protein [Sporomusa sp. KB1]TWH46358.1 hypothetical protein Salpa_2339 [Sporomusa sp. KB1]
MHIHLNIEADTTEEILAAIKELSATGVVHTQTKPAEAAADPKKNAPRNNKPTAQKTPEPDPATTTAPSDDDATSETAEEAADTIPTVEEIKKAAVEKGKTLEGKKAIKDLLVSFESKSLSAIPEDKRAAFLAALEEL